ncbi:hypothetical protein ACFFX0_01850 [Citricoccus parietis]|uniref:Uncharacterized protein n=1 Tax=Citricoccus parietis TaxID=592307 RepID=A0ABV5FTK8_9MICC
MAVSEPVAGAGAIPRGARADAVRGARRGSLGCFGAHPVAALRGQDRSAFRRTPGPRLPRPAHAGR